MAFYSRQRMAWAMPVNVMQVRSSAGGTLSRRDPMKVAQHSSAGLTLRKATRPGRDDRSPSAIDKSNWCQKTSASIVPLGTDPSLCHFPALNCWATFTLSLRDRSLSPIQPLGNLCILLPVRIFFFREEIFSPIRPHADTVVLFGCGCDFCVPLRLL
jgi:hypothetical protein